MSSRANGRLSHGPVTEAGKLRSSKNSIQHGLLAKNVLLDGESEEFFVAIFKQLLRSVRPVNGVEQRMVADAVSAAWRRERAYAIEDCLTRAEMANVDPSLPPMERIAAAYENLQADGKLAVLRRYQGTFDTRYRRAIQNIELLRKLNREHPLGEDGSIGVDLDDIDDPPAPEPVTEPEPEAEPAPPLPPEDNLIVLDPPQPATPAEPPASPQTTQPEKANSLKTKVLDDPSPIPEQRRRIVLRYDPDIPPLEF